MNTSTSTAPILHSREFFQQKETAVLQQIPGVYELLSAYDDQRPALEKKYPDAAFVLNISSNLFFHDRELTNIHMNAYSSILKGDPIADVPSAMTKRWTPTTHDTTGTERKKAGRIPSLEVSCRP